MKEYYRKRRQMFRERGGNFTLHNSDNEIMLQVNLGNLTLKLLTLNNALQQRLDDVINTAISLIDTLTIAELERIKNS